MPRSRRAWAPGLGAHIVSRFVDRNFHLADDVDRRMFQRALDHATQRWDWEILSYALMSSHVHYGTLAGIRAPEGFFRSVHTRFACRFHRRRNGETLGPVFAGRPTLHVVGRTSLLRMVAYHHRNPVSAGVVEQPKDSRWTSHRAYLRLDPPPAWLNVERSLDLLGFEDTAAGRRRFDTFVTEVKLDEPLPREKPTPLEEIDCHPNDDWQRLEALARELVGLDHHEPINARHRSAALARRLIGIVAVQRIGQSNAEAAARLGICAGSLSNLLARTNRDDVDVDRLAQELLRRFRIG